MEAESARSSTFASLVVRDYRLLWLGGFVSFLSVQMQMIARNWLAYDLTGTNASLGTVMFGFGVPMLFLTPFGGVAADRFSKRGIILTTQWLLILSSVAVAILLVMDSLSFGLLVVSGAIQGAAFSFLGPARMAFTSELVGRRLLPNAVVLQQMSMNGTRVFGPSLAGLLLTVAWFGPEGVYFLTAVLTVIASAMTLRLPAGRPKGERRPDGPLAEFASGLRYVRANPHLMLLLLVSLAVVMAAFPYITFLPALSDQVYDAGSTGYGLMSGASAVGAVVASLVIAARSGGPGAWRIQAGAGVIFGAALVLLAVAPSFAIALVVLALLGAATSVFQTLNNSLALTGSESAYHGRVQSLMMLSFSGFGLIALPLGVLADHLGLAETIAAMGSVTILAMVVYIVARPVIERNHPTPTYLD